MEEGRRKKRKKAEDRKGQRSEVGDRNKTEVKRPKREEMKQP
jgi:hypothetical protein